jgi:Ni/Fe-hydrogenase 1 B-type cytochrome subunit
MNTNSTNSFEVDTRPTFNDFHSLAIRIWHWTFFVILTASLVCVLFGSTAFKTNDNIALVQDQLKEKGAIVTKDQARAVAHEYSDKLWNLHKYLGYVLCGLLLSRIIIEIAQPSEENFRVKIKKTLGFKPVIEEEKTERRHYLQVKTVYLIFYMLILTMALTGLGLAFEDSPILKDIQKPIRNVHGFVQYFIYGFILIHLIGVISADLGKYNGLISGMIHGKKRKNERLP